MTHSVEIKDEKVYRSVKWLIAELERYHGGEFQIHVKKNRGDVVLVEKTVKQKE